MSFQEKGHIQSSKLDTLSLRLQRLQNKLRSLNSDTYSASIVFVHGLNGHPQKTWTSYGPSQAAASGDVDGDEEATQGHANPRTASNKERQKARHELTPEVFWPRDFLPRFFPQDRTLTWGYDVKLLEMLLVKSEGSVFHHAEALLADLVRERSTSKNEKTALIFITHSLGGIVVKDALSISRSDLAELSGILPITIGVIFLGTPHHGSKATSLGNSCARLAKSASREPDIGILSP